ncbi:hypothetical protein AB0469_09685 [Streptomyces sp. NPDC093801]|uniref:hypothetical protein n=1 Tax=Streptomyces sp. NPDC093801 TaxID=3155203 RepID=UPI00344B50DF
MLHALTPRTLTPRALGRLAALLLLAAALPASPAAALPASSGAALPASSGAALPASPAAAADEPGWTAEPASASAAPARRPSFYLAGPAGTVLEDRLALANTGDRERVVTLRGADAYNTADGAFAVRPAAGGRPGGAARAAGSWISFGAAATVALPPHTRAVVPFTVTVPPASPPGDHPAAVVAAEGGREVGVRVDLRVGGPALAALTVEDVSVRGRGSAASVAYTLVNRGNVALTPTLALHAAGGLGRASDPRPARPLAVELLPGQRVALTEPWPGAPALDRVSLRLTVTAPGAAPATATATAWLVPGGGAARAGVGLLVLGAAAAVLVPALRRGPPGRRGRPRDEPHAPDGGPSAPAAASEPELTGAPR